MSQKPLIIGKDGELFAHLFDGAQYARQNLGSLCMAVGFISEIPCIARWWQGSNHLTIMRANDGIHAAYTIDIITSRLRERLTDYTFSRYTDTQERSVTLSFYTDKD